MSSLPIAPASNIEVDQTSPRPNLHEICDASGRIEALTAALQAAEAREQVLLRRAEASAKRQELDAKELNHRLYNGLQSIASLLSSQARTATHEAAAQLTVAVSRIFAFGQVHRRLNLLNQFERVEFTSFLGQLCAELSELLLVQTGSMITVEGEKTEIPAATAIPLGFIVNELVTNCVKYAGGDIAVRLLRLATGEHLLSVSDQGPGLSATPTPVANRGLGTKIVQALVQEIGGDLLFGPGDGGRGLCATVRFRLADAVAKPEPATSPDEVRRWIAQANIDQFIVLMATETDPTKQAIFAALLTAERSKQACSISNA